MQCKKRKAMSQQKERRNKRIIPLTTGPAPTSSGLRFAPFILINISKCISSQNECFAKRYKKALNLGLFCYLIASIRDASSVIETFFASPAVSSCFFCSSRRSRSRSSLSRFCRSFSPSGPSNCNSVISLRA